MTPRELVRDLSARFAKRGGSDKLVVVSLDSNVVEIQGFPRLHAIRAYQWPFDLQDPNSATHLL